MAKQKPKVEKLVEWECRSQCRSNCCSDLFLRLNPIQKIIFDKSKKIVEKSMNLDLEWLSYRNGISFEKLNEEAVVITVLTQDYKVMFNEADKMHYVYIPEKCNKLDNEGKCTIYDKRPNVCKISLCPIFSDNPRLEWFARNGKLKQQIEAYKKGELKKDV